MVKHSCTQEWRLASMETNLSNYKEYMWERFDKLEKFVEKSFGQIAEKIDTIIEHSDVTYAKKEEVDQLNQKINSIQQLKTWTTIEWIKNKWLIIVTAISSLTALLTTLLK